MTDLAKQHAITLIPPNLVKIAAQIRFDWPPGPYLNPFVEKTLEEEEVHEGLFRLVFHPRSHQNHLHLICFISNDLFK